LPVFAPNRVAAMGTRTWAVLIGEVRWAGDKGVGSCPPALPGERVPLAQGGASRRVVESLRPALGGFSPHPTTPERGD
jgi:hypothetical protein